MPSKNFRNATRPRNPSNLTPIDPAAPNLPPVENPNAPFRYSPTQISPAPGAISTSPDQLQNWKRPSVSQVRIFALPPQQSVSAGAAGASQIANQIQPLSDLATSADLVAKSANTTADGAAAGVTTINGQSAVAVVAGVLTQVHISALPTATSTPTLDALTDGVTYNRVLATALTSNAIDTTQPGFRAKGGSFPSTVVGSSAAIFSYTAVASTHTVVISWSTFDIFFADGTSMIIFGSSQTITGVSTGTSYFYPFLATNIVLFVTGASGSAGYSPDILYVPQSPQAAQAMNSQAVTALSSSGLPVVMPGSGSGGGSGICVMASQFVREKTKGVVRLTSCDAGDYLDSRHGFTKIETLKFIPQGTFIRFTTPDDEALSVTPTHHLTVLRNGEETRVKAAEITLSDFLFHESGLRPIKKIEVVESLGARKAFLHLEPTHEFWCGEESPTLSASNVQPIS